MQAYCILDGLGALNLQMLVDELIVSEHPGLNRHLIRLTEQFGGLSTFRLTQIANALADPQVRLQAAYMLGASKDRGAGNWLAMLAGESAADLYLVAAAMSSLCADNIGGALKVVSHWSSDAVPDQLVSRILAVAVALMTPEDLAKSLSQLLANQSKSPDSMRFAVVAGILDGLERQRRPAAEFPDKKLASLFQEVFAQAQKRSPTRTLPTPNASRPFGCSVGSPNNETKTLKHSPDSLGPSILPPCNPPRSLRWAESARTRSPVC